MAAVVNDARGLRVVRPLGPGVLLAVVSALSFGLSGSLAAGLLSTGWTPGAIVLVRVGVAALALAPAAAVSLRGRWRQLLVNLPQVLIYGTLAVAGAQFCYFSAVATMDVGPALLIEYTAPAAVVAWLWVRHGRRPGVWTLAGAALAALGLVLVLDLLSGAHLAWPGVAWALAAMVGATVYFVISADDDSGLPALALAGAGLLVGALGLAALGVAGVLPLRAATVSPAYAVGAVPWWLPLLALGLVTAALAYATGIAASRHLGSQVASFVALLEVVAGVGFAWWLLGQRPGASQVVGGLIVVAGVIVVKLAENRASAPSVRAPVTPVPERRSLGG